METRTFRSIVSLLAACLLVTTAAAQTIRLKVFRGTLVHSRVRTEIEVLEDYLIGFDENNFGRVSTELLRFMRNDFFYLFYFYFCDSLYHELGLDGLLFLHRLGNYYFCQQKTAIV